MKVILKLNDYPDILGSFASGLCLIHCLITPFLFAVHTGSIASHPINPLWWGSLDIFFICISLVAIYFSAKNTSRRWMKYAFWISWMLLFGVILNEKIQGIEIAEEIIYLPSIALIILHIYNYRFCQCTNESCCSH